MKIAPTLQAASRRHWWGPDPLNSRGEEDQFWNRVDRELRAVLAVVRAVRSLKPWTKRGTFDENVKRAIDKLERISRAAP